ncbi:hypothetical protein [Psychrobacillus sp. FSL H8-0487]|uniref:hypothetical protein n=1 Tax=Psychrobacillus sp. FSL H8-0487 TaxID=2921391 RepID=UPI0030F5A783
MDKLFVFMMLLPFSLVLLFQPALDRMEEGREKIVQVAIQRGVEKAAVDGYFTEENLDSMYKLLESAGFERDDVIFNGTLLPVYRGQYIEGSLQVPNTYQFLLFENLVSGEASEKYHFHSATRMSEAIN